MANTTGKIFGTDPDFNTGTDTVVQWGILNTTAAVYSGSGDATAVPTAGQLWPRVNW